MADKAVLPAVRVQVEQGLEHLTTACAILRTNGWPENADELMRTVRHGRVWTQKDGWLDMLERKPIEVRE
jgi:hypothetical protein